MMIKSKLVSIARVLGRNKYWLRWLKDDTTTKERHAAVSLEKIVVESLHVGFSIAVMTSYDFEVAVSATRTPERVSARGSPWLS
jgi:hypothetical protein